MANIELILPSIGEGIIEAKITKWLISEGDKIEEDEPLIEIATDKVDSEIPAPATGKLVKIIYREGETPKIGEVIGILQTNGEDIENPSIKTGNTGKMDKLKTDKEKRQSPKPAVAKGEFEFTNENTIQNNISTLIRNLAKTRGITYDELKQIKGSGNDGDITKEDLNNYILANRPFRVEQPALKPVRPADPEEMITPGIREGEELVEMDRMRKIISQHMVESLKISAHVTSFVELDVTGMVQWRNKVKNLILQREQVKLTFTPIIVEAVAKAIREYPNINISVTGDKIIKKNYINIGVATALDNGNLIVPVIKFADKENLLGLAHKIQDLSTRARKNELKPVEITGGTFTVTNMGQFNNVTGTPIINQPEVAILAIGSIKRKPAVVISDGIESIGIRDILILSLTYDHRVVDGALGGSFLSRVGYYLENFDINRPV
ncbi:MAG: 2-oxo acid dehydrogenase subunit E2 [Bacteroidales bacterium]|nr:2-oxo acid dehydrogenase subunit E2 [Bacteroidales bacterium]